MAVAATQDLTGVDALERSATFEREFEIQNPDTSAFDLTGYDQFAAEFRTAPEGYVLAYATVTVVGLATAGVLSVAISANEARYLREGGEYEVRARKTSDGTLTSLVRGSFEVVQNVTQAYTTASS